MSNNGAPFEGARSGKVNPFPRKTVSINPMPGTTSDSSPSAPLTGNAFVNSGTEKHPESMAKPFKEAPEAGRGTYEGQQGEQLEWVKQADTEVRDVYGKSKAPYSASRIGKGPDGITKESAPGKRARLAGMNTTTKQWEFEGVEQTAMGEKPGEVDAPFDAARKTKS